MKAWRGFYWHVHAVLRGHSTGPNEVCGKLVDMQKTPSDEKAPPSRKLTKSGEAEFLHRMQAIDTCILALGHRSTGPHPMEILYDEIPVIKGLSTAFTGV